MSLVESRGFDAVTIEDICQAADISRRTFFNYMDSKDEAVLGSFPFALPDESFEAIATTPSGNVLELIFSQLTVRPDALGRDHLLRRRAILKRNPALAGAAFERGGETLMRLGRAVDKHLANFPADRKLPEAPTQIEANAIVNLFYVSVSTYLSNPDFPATDPLGVDSLRAAARFHIDLAKELSW